MSHIDKVLNQPFFSSKTPKNKKYSVYIWKSFTNSKNINKGKIYIIHFGARGYEQYYDKIGKYRSSDHGDVDRRAAYRARHKAILKDGKPAYLNKASPEYWSWNYLW